MDNIPSTIQTLFSLVFGFSVLMLELMAFEINHVLTPRYC